MAKRLPRGLLNALRNGSETVGLVGRLFYGIDLVGYRFYIPSYNAYCDIAKQTIQKYNLDFNPSKEVKRLHMFPEKSGEMLITKEELHGLPVYILKDRVVVARLVNSCNRRLVEVY